MIPYSAYDLRPYQSDTPGSVATLPDGASYTTGELPDSVMSGDGPITYGAHAARPPREAAPVPLWRKAVNFLVAIGAHVCGGFQSRPLDAQAAAVAVCEHGAGLPALQILDGHCDHYRPSDGTCGGDGCGCYVEIKARWAEQRCPLGRWPKLAPPGDSV